MSRSRIMTSRSRVMTSRSRIMLNRSRVIVIKPKDHCDVSKVLRLLCELSALLHVLS